MEYIPFSKLRYKISNYQEKYQQVFSHPDTIHLDFSICDNPAFLVPCSEAYKLALEIYKLNTSIYRLSDSLPSDALRSFTVRCMIDEILLSNDIEGVNSTRKEITAVLNRLPHSKHLRFTGLVSKYQKLQNSDIIPLNGCRDIRTLYDELVLPEVLTESPENAPDGQIFRKDSVSVCSPIGKEIHQGVLPESEIIIQMEKSLFFLQNDKIDILFRIAGFHYLFGYIHPFYDGNGRTSRFISSYLLSQGLHPLIAYRLSYTIKEHTQDYYNVFKICNDPRNLGDITPFVLIFLEILQEAMLQLKNALSERKERLEHYQNLLQQNSFTKQEQYRFLCSLLLHSSLFSENGTNTQELLSLLDTTLYKLKTRLKELSNEGYLISQKRGREVYYQLNLEKLEEQTPLK